MPSRVMGIALVYVVDGRRILMMTEGRDVWGMLYGWKEERGEARGGMKGDEVFEREEKLMCSWYRHHHLEVICLFPFLPIQSNPKINIIHNI